MAGDFTIGYRLKRSILRIMCKGRNLQEHGEEKSEAGQKTIAGCRPHSRPAVGIAVRKGEGRTA
jgi:hypothetical protein